MQIDQEITLIRDTLGTIIPAGEERIIPAGTTVSISQALGGSVTVRTPDGLYRIPSKDWDALGKEMQSYLKKKSETNSSPLPDLAFSESLIWDALKQCYDPEIPLNIVDLGLIYDLKYTEPDEAKLREVSVQMTLTAQGCGMGPVIAEDAKNQMESISCISKANVTIVWEPPWNPHMISEEGRQKLGLE